MGARARRAPALPRLSAGGLLPQPQQLSVAAEMARHVDLRNAGVAQAPDGEPQAAARLYHLRFGLFQLLVCLIQGPSGLLSERGWSCSPHTAMITPLSKNASAGLRTLNRFGMLGVRQDAELAAWCGERRQNGVPDVCDHHIRALDNPRRLHLDHARADGF